MTRETRQIILGTVRVETTIVLLYSSVHRERVGLHFLVLVGRT